jgi:hypothetical protein
MLPPTLAFHHPRVVDVAAAAVPAAKAPAHTPISVIQLDEVPAPPRPLKAMTSSAGLSSSSWSSSRSDDFSATESDDSDAPCTSYCSSAEDECAEDVDMDVAQTHYDDDEDDSFSLRMKRILAWREASAKAMGTAPPSKPLSPPLQPAVPALTGIPQHARGRSRPSSASCPTRMTWTL